ncbi:hypothetical protein CPB85DRAFT_1435391 [Mucidula mucida]|nr:hypothetical protein CPB85DRAFT_1435391 [Mucidula mucida]
MDRPDNAPAPVPDDTPAPTSTPVPVPALAVSVPEPVRASTERRASSQHRRATYASPHRISQLSFADPRTQEASLNGDPLGDSNPIYQPLPSLPQRETKHLSSDVDWIIPVEKPHRVKTVGERLQPTLSTAEEEKTKYAFKAKMTGYALNIAIGLQVMLGALTTGISAATTGKSTSIAICILGHHLTGGISTMVASYLARARGSNEPELSITRVKDLEQFIRECKAFQMDHGHCAGNEFDSNLDSLRRRFEELLGNANGERKLSAPV